MATTFRAARERDEKSEYKFWKSKPVTKITDRVIDSAQIRTSDKLIKKYGKNDETGLPSGYSWELIQIDSDNLSRVATFLNQYYRETFITEITSDKIRWETMGRGFFVCVTEDSESESDKNIVGCLGLTEKTLQINSDIRTVAEAIYLCTLNDLRETGISKVLINETIRQGVLANYDVGVFCDSVIVPTPVATIRYFTRPLNYKHLKANDFVGINEVDDDVAHDRIKIKLKAPKSIYLAEKTDENVELAHRLYREYMKSFNLHHTLTTEEVANYFFDERYVRTIFYENDAGKVVDFLTYRFYDIVNTEREVDSTEKYDNIIRATNILAYSSNYNRPDILIMNAFKVISRQRHHLVYVPDMMGSNEIILSNVKKSDEDTDDEEENALFDQHIMKSRKKQFINLFNWRTASMTQEMVSYLIFN
jgi:Myristoyl-CoA:protein N-myristoyltransferase, N-terminal domain